MLIIAIGVMVTPSVYSPPTTLPSDYWTTPAPTFRALRIRLSPPSSKIMADVLAFDEKYSRCSDEASVSLADGCELRFDHIARRVRHIVIVPTQSYAVAGYVVDDRAVQPEVVLNRTSVIRARVLDQRLQPVRHRVVHIAYEQFLWRVPSAPDWVIWTDMRIESSQYSSNCELFGLSVFADGTVEFTARTDDRGQFEYSGIDGCASVVRVDGVVASPLQDGSTYVIVREQRKATFDLGSFRAGLECLRDQLPAITSRSERAAARQGLRATIMDWMDPLQAPDDVRKQMQKILDEVLPANDGSPHE